jgi:two-component system sensor histidine kinase KdpD
VAGSAELLLSRLPPDGDAEGRDLLGSIRDESRRLGNLVGDLLELTRLRTGPLRPDSQWIPLEEAVHAALDSLEPLLAGREVRTELPEEEVLVHADPLLLERVLANLLENAAKFSPAGSPVEIAGSVDGREAVIEVRDRGPGIPPGEEERIFEKFYRSARDAGTEGHGLGLSICRAAAEALGGTVSAANREGGGSVFRVRLPLPSEAPRVGPEGPGGAA